MSAAIADAVRQHLTEKYKIKFGGGSNVGDDTDLMDIGLIDSFGFVELVQYLEDRYRITFDDAELSSNELATVSGLTAAIEKKTQTQDRSGKTVPAAAVFCGRPVSGVPGVPRAGAAHPVQDLVT
jgi:acyl carrier protein